MNKKTGILALIFTAFAIVVCILYQTLFSGTVSLYIVVAVMLLLSALPFMLGFERSKPTAREMALMATLIALAVASRAAFYLVPQFKPIGAVVIVSAVCLGAERGYIIGAFSAFISNLIFGQGIWTPYQMVALGLVGFAAGLIFEKVRADRIRLAAVGFFLTFALYGLIVDLSSVLIMVNDYSIKSVFAIYLAGVPFSAIFGATTAVTLFLFGEPFIKKIRRIITKYGITEG